jgi:hypothetical protein
VHARIIAGDYPIDGIATVDFIMSLYGPLLDCDKLLHQRLVWPIAKVAMLTANGVRLMARRTERPLAIAVFILGHGHPLNHFCFAAMIVTEPLMEDSSTLLAQTFVAMCEANGSLNVSHRSAALRPAP